NWIWQTDYRYSGYNYSTTTPMKNYPTYWLTKPNEPNNDNRDEDCLVVEGRYRVYQQLMRQRLYGSDHYPIDAYYSSQDLGWNDFNCCLKAPFFIQYRLLP